MADVRVQSVQGRSRRVLANITNDIIAGRGSANKPSKALKSAPKNSTVACPFSGMDEVYENMRANESRYYACQDYIYALKQNAITHKMRTILMSWLVEVADEYELCCQTIHLAVYLVDTYLCKHHHVSRTELQLIGIACMLIAAKYEEMNPPSAYDCSYITDFTYTSQQVLDMERTILITMQFRVSAVTSLEFRRFFQCDHPLVNYLLELALLHPVCLCYRPSQLAAAACAYARAALGERIWPEIMKARSRYSFEEIRPIIVLLQDIHCSSFDKPSLRHKKVSKLPPLKRIPKSI